MMHRLLIVVLIFATAAVGQMEGSGAQTTADDFAFMKGCWEFSKPSIKATISEQWMEPSGGTLIGMSRYVRAGKTSDYEYMRIEVRDIGIYFVSKTRGNKEEVSFRLRYSMPGHAIFENLQHDYPQRIIYRSEKPNTLFARIEGTRNGKSSGTDFPYKRVMCG